MIKTVRFNNTHNQNFGGYVMYFRLLFLGETSMINQISRILDCLSFKLKVELFLQLAYQIPYWLLIKPMGALFSFKYVYAGSYTFNDDYNKFFYDADKKIIFKFLGIPYFVWYSSNLNKIDIDRIADFDADSINVVNSKFSKFR